MPWYKLRISGWFYILVINLFVHVFGTDHCLTTNKFWEFKNFYYPITRVIYLRTIINT